MAFFRTVSLSDLMPAITGAGVVLRAPQMSDCAEWVALREASRDFLTPWEPTWPADDLTRASFRRRIKLFRGSARRPRLCFLASASTTTFLSAVSLLRTFVAAARGSQPRLLMGAGACAARSHDRGGQCDHPFAFGTLKLHRIEAACIPANVASVRLLERTGFQREGFARQYLCIDGAWQDHLLYARIKDDPSP
jgi:ribosomal-protein-alanine N-acetyltransferase